MRLRLRRTRTKIFVFVVGLGWAINLAVFFHWTNSRTFRTTKHYFMRFFSLSEILPYPLDIPDAETFVADLIKETAGFNVLIVVKDAIVVFDPICFFKDDMHAHREASRPVWISPINFNYTNINISENSMQCSDAHTQSFSILVLIKTRASEAASRTHLRNIFQNQSILSKSEVFIQYGFLIGQSTENISEELSHNNDFVIGDFIDSYQNLTLKSMMGVRWAMEHCPQFDFYISTDVDNHIVLENVLKFLRDPFNYPEVRKDLRLGHVVKSSEHFYSGGIVKLRHGKAYPIRDPRSLLYLSLQDYPLSVLPPYVSGRLLIMSQKTLSSFYHLSPFVQHVPLEDVYFGLLANKLGIKPLRELWVDPLLSADQNKGHFSFYDLDNALAIHEK